MKKSTQARLADWTITIGCSSMILPFIALFSIFGLGSGGIFWLGCFGIAGFAVLNFWLVSKIKNEKTEKKIPVWLLSICYFATMTASVAVAFDSFEVGLILSMAEGIGLVLSAIGLIHALTTNKKPNQSVDTTAVSAPR